VAVYKVTNEYIDLENGTTILLINSPTHGLKEVYIDSEDKEKVSQYHWNVCKRPRPENTFNVVTPKNDELDSTLLYRLIMNAPNKLTVDHIDGNELNNRKNNLRVCTKADNNKNLGMKKNNKSGYKGVIWYPYNNYNKWKATIKVNSKTINLGYFDNIEDAVKVRKEAELKYFGEYNRTIST
jgi:hypothetical protein